jgi:hemoglobin-like flavoprotein
MYYREPATMTPQEIRLVRSSFARLEPRAMQCAELFLGHILRADPGLSPMLKGDPAAQGQRLMQLMSVAVGLLDKPGQLDPVLRKLGARFAGRGIGQQHCDALGAALLRALYEATGDAFDADTCDAWVSMHEIVSRTMIAAARAEEFERSMAYQRVVPFEQAPLSEPGALA